MFSSTIVCNEIPGEEESAVHENTLRTYNAVQDRKGRLAEGRARHLPIDSPGNEEALPFCTSVPAKDKTFYKCNDNGRSYVD